MADPADQQVEIPDVAETERGSLKVFLGMAAGVGKTYRMLQEGRAEAEGERDVVVGFLEPHGRKETVEQAGDLEFVPRRKVPYRETVLEEMDLPGLIRRAPDLALIDELAHTNAPGLEHGKRYEDVEDVLAAGIDVYSTVNVQHLESLNDSICELTGVRVRETMPDAVLNAADEVVLMDLTQRRFWHGCVRARSTRRRESTLLSTTSSAWRTWLLCERSHCGRWPMRSRPSAWSRRRWASGMIGWRTARRARRWGSGCWR